MKVNPDFLQKVKSAVNLIDVVGEHVVLRKSGSNYSGLCPFHQERSPSFSVSENKQVYHCYGCKKGGDVISFVTEIFGISFPEAVAELADRANIPLPKGAEDLGDEDPAARERRLAAREKTATAFKLNRFVAQFYHQILAKNAIASQYVGRRGVKGDLLKNFYVGYAPAEWDALSRFLVAKQAPLPLAVELGLIRPSTKDRPGGGPGHFDLFRNRAIFPILDMRGKVAGFGGRSLPSPESGEAESPKYLNSSESFLFQKSKLAFGLYQAQKFAREKDEVIIVEGYFDVLALHAAGFQNVVATCGTSLTPEHLNLLRKFASRITILFDGDKAGIAATERAMELGLDHGVVLYGAAMPEDLDPDEVLFDQDTGNATADGIERMKSILSSAAPIIDKRIDEQIAESRGGPEARTQALKQVARWLAGFKDPVGREVRIESVQERMGVDRALLEKAAAVPTKGGARPSGPVPLTGPTPVGGPGFHQPPQGQGPMPGMPRPLGAPGRPVQGPPPGAFQQGHRGQQGIQQGQFGPPGRNRPQSPDRDSERVRSAAPGPARLSPAETALLREMVRRAGEFRPWIERAVAYLPENAGFAALFDYPPARQFVESLLADSGALDQFGKTPAQYLSTVEDPRLRQLLTEACVGSADAAKAEQEQDSPDLDLKKALERRLAKFWARFSQQIKAALADAEAKKDAGLQARLMKEYLDVQRKMKEFNSFYDEA